jgi:hypothetical protein
MNAKRFIKRITIFVLPIIVLAIIIEMVIRYMPNDYKLKEKQLILKREKIKILTLGGSHTYYGIKPELFDSVTYNMAYVSQTLLFDKLIIEKYIDTLPNLKVLILPIAYISLSQQYGDGEEKWRKFNYFRYYGIEPPFGKWYQKYYLELLNLPSKKNLTKVYYYLSGKNMYSCDSTGWCNTFEHEKVSNLNKSAKKAAKRHENGVMDFSQNNQYLNDIIAVCKEKNIKVFLITFPFWKSYRENLNHEKFQKIVNTCEAYDRENENVYYFNYSNYDSVFNTPDYFNDADHLSVKGAIDFSKLVNKMVIENW